MVNQFRGDAGQDGAQNTARAAPKNDGLVETEIFDDSRNVSRVLDGVHALLDLDYAAGHAASVVRGAGEAILESSHEWKELFAMAVAAGNA
jgi:hypothetical protein